MKKLSLALMLGTALVTFFASCSREDQDEIIPSAFKPSVPQDTITSFYVYFSNPLDSSVEVGVIEDLDGPGPKETNIGGVTLKANTHYDVTFAMEDATNPKQSVYIHKKILNYPKDYKVCISNPFGISVYPTDSDGKYPIGLENSMNTSSVKGNCNISFSVKYQKGVKNGQCEPGTVLFHCNIPVTID